jgi:Flp pilus assembly protein TadB
MKAETPTYQRLPGKKKGFIIGHHSLWRSSDHLLQIYARWGVEDYKRFYFSDIQAIITRKTGAGRIQNIVMGGLAGLFCVFAATSGGGWVLFNVITAVAMLLILMANVFRGPTCETHLLTAVQTEKLHSLHRLNTALKVMDQLRSIIERHQGHIDPETLAQQSARPAGNRDKVTPTSRAQQASKAQKHESGRVHLMLFALLIFDGLIVASGFVSNHVGLTVLSTVVMMMIGICVVVALVKQNQSNLKRSLRIMTWAALGYVCFSFVSAYVLSLGLAFKNPQAIRNQLELIKLFASVTPWDSPFLMTINILALSATFAIGIAGLCMLKNPWQTNPQPSRLPAAPVSTAAPKRIP